MKNILITGASKGFGFELLKVFLSKKWKVFPLVRNLSTINHLIDEYKTTCFPIVGDITDPKISDKINEVLKLNCTNLDVLINNAGNKIITSSIFDTLEKDLDDHLQVHCIGALRVTKSCYNFIEKSINPIILNITSRKGSLTNTNKGIYTPIYSYQIAKSAQNMLTSCMNQEFNGKIKIFAIHPGRLKTSAAPPDADTEPEFAAYKLYDWIHDCDNKDVGKLHDIIDEVVLDW